jgi:KUP system potassium uptake protein
MTTTTEPIAAATPHPPSSAHHPAKPMLPLAVGALGVVFGDIGTSPLYTLKECLHFLAHDGHVINQTDVYQVLSLIFWSMLMVVTVKYLLFVMRADNKGEGGIMALLALMPEKWRVGDNNKLTIAAILVCIGAGCLYGDGAITPAISILSAVEGLRLAQPDLSQNVVVGITVFILMGLFAIQRRGTASIGSLFGPVMFVWFSTIGGLGLFHILKNPDVLNALSPLYAVQYFQAHGAHGLLILGFVVLCVTGGEALYADMGHFGLKPIRACWLLFVWPCLVLAYFGQGALVLANPDAAANPFFAMVPTGWAVYALVALSGAATVIASQSLITGSFSLTRQAMQMGYFPRVTIKHTAEDHEGQIYIPEVNLFLFVACLMLVLGFRESSALADAYGLAVTSTMTITSVLFFAVLVGTKKWSVARALPLTLMFLFFDIPFFLANLRKLPPVPIIIAASFVVVMLLWHQGRRLIAENYLGRYRPFEETWTDLSKKIAQRTPGMGVFMASTGSGVPPILAHHVRRTHALHKQVILLTVVTKDVPHVARADRYRIEEMGHGFQRVTFFFGYMDDPNVPRALNLTRVDRELEFSPDEVTYYLARERVLAKPGGSMGSMLESAFGFMQRNSVNADRHFNIPAEQVIEVGQQIDL